MPECSNRHVNNSVPNGGTYLHSYAFVGVLQPLKKYHINQSIILEITKQKPNVFIILL